MWELWVVLMVVGAWVLAAGSAGFVGSFLVQHLGDRQVAKRVAKHLVDPSDDERPVTTESGVAPAANPALVFVRASGPAFADREMAHATSTTA